MRTSPQPRIWTEQLVRRFLTSRPGVWFGQQVLARLDRSLLYLSRGRYSFSPGQPVLLLVTIGAKTGPRRARPLLFCRDGARLVVIAANGGHDWQPVWYHNLRAHPEATVYVDRQVGSTWPTRRTARSARRCGALLWPISRILRNINCVRAGLFQ